MGSRKQSNPLHPSAFKWFPSLYTALFSNTLLHVAVFVVVPTPVWSSYKLALGTLRCQSRVTSVMLSELNEMLLLSRVTILRQSCRLGNEAPKWWCRNLADWLDWIRYLNQPPSHPLNANAEYCCWPCSSLYGLNLPSSNGFLQHAVAGQKVKAIANWFHEQQLNFSGLPLSPDLNPIGKTSETR